MEGDLKLHILSLFIEREKIRAELQNLINKEQQINKDLFEFLKKENLA